MRNVSASLLVFVGGFVIMVLEIIGARYLAKHVGVSFYVWVSQIGVILTALTLGYFAGGALADWWQRTARLAWLLAPAGVFTFFIPNFAGAWIEAIVQRHPGEDIPLLWQKLDPAIGSTVVFLLPCSVLATLSPYMVRLSAQRLGHVGRISGLIYSASTAGSIAGVFVSGYVLIDYLSVPSIFRTMGVLTLILGGLCLALDRCFRVNHSPQESL